MLLNLGSGDLPALAPWVNVDSGHFANADVVNADVRALPFADGSVSRAYCGHLLEHLSLDDGVPAALAEIARVLAPDGVACFVGPCYERAKAWNDSVLLDVIRDGGNRWAGDEHLWLSTTATALAAIRVVFPLAREVSLSDLEDWPLAADAAWQFAVLSN